MIESDIRLLLAAPAVGEGAPSLAAIEHTLTAGYARAMALEAEQRRLRRKLTDLAVSAAAEDARPAQRDLREDAARLRASERELLRLRQLLRELRGRAAQARAA
jgi:hypothetical protein